MNRMETYGDCARLSAESEIRKVLASYGVAIDRDDLEAVRACYHLNASDDRGDRFVGTVDELIDWLRGIRAGVSSTTHLMGEPLIELGGTVATTVTPCLVLSQPSSPAPASGRLQLIGMYYYDVFSYSNGHWRIVSRRGEYVEDGVLLST
jgi:hypothetical protein